jgi:FHS family L-fucose permease-like MFS transporter
VNFSNRDNLSDSLQLYVLLLIFLMWGAANSLNHLLIHEFMKVFRLTRLGVTWLQPAYYFGYIAAVLPSAFLVRRRGAKAGLLTGLALFLTAASLVVLGLRSEDFPLLVFSMSMLAMGVSTMESTAGPYILNSRPGEAGKQRLFLAQAFNSLGLLVGASVGTFFVFTGEKLVALSPGKVLDSLPGASLSVEAQRASTPFKVLLVLSLCLMAVVLRLPFRDDGVFDPAKQRSVFAPFRDASFRRAFLSVFIYMGVQTCSWSFLLQYARQYGWTSDRSAGFLLMASMAFFAIGRFLQAMLPKLGGSSKFLLAASLFGLGCAVVGVTLPGVWGAMALTASSLALSVMYPLLFTLGVGPMKDQMQLAGSLMVFGVGAGGILPPLMAVLCHATGSFALGYLIPCLGYCWIARFAWMMSHRHSYIPVEANQR